MRRDLSTLDRDIGQPWSRIIQEAFEHGIDGTIMQGGLLPGREVQGIHEASKDQNYLLESRLMTRDGRVFYYARAGAAACIPGLGCKFCGKLKWGGGTAAKADKYSKTVMIKNNGKTFIEDELYGGYLLLHDVTNMQNRRIIGNTPGATIGAIASAVIGLAGLGYFTITADVADSFKKGDKIVVYGSSANDGIYTVKDDAVYASVTTILVDEAVTDDTPNGSITGIVTLTLEEGLSGNFDENNWSEILPNPYKDLQEGNIPKASHAGMPGTYAATGEYFWVQTWGPCWIKPGGPHQVGIEENERTVVFVGDGSVNSAAETAVAGLSKGHQIAGFIIENNTDDTGPPLVMLQIRP